MKNKLRDAFLAITVIDDNDKKELLSSFDKRMKMSVKPIHLAAIFLDPNGVPHRLDDSVLNNQSEGCAKDSGCYLQTSQKLRSFVFVFI